MKDGGGGTRRSGGRKSSSGVQGQSPGGGLGRSPQKPTTYENNCQKHRPLVGQSKNNKIEGFGGRPPVGGRPGSRGPLGPLNPALFGLDKYMLCNLAHYLQSIVYLCTHTTV